MGAHIHRPGDIPTETGAHLRLSPQLKSYDGPPSMTINPARRYLARFKTEKGDFIVELAAKDVPTIVNNFVFLARDGYYDNTTFHKVVGGFFSQGGDRRGDGRGDPGYRFADEFSPNVRHDASGVITMANRGPNTNGSQFLILHTASPHLDGRNLAFGRVIEGLDVVLSLTPRDLECDWPPPSEPGTGSTPLRSRRLSDTMSSHEGATPLPRVTEEAPTPYGGSAD